MDDKEIVSAVRIALADKVGRDRFELWFGPKARLSLRGETLTIEVHNRFVQDWIRANFRREIEQAAVEAVGRAVSIEFRVDEALAQANCSEIGAKIERKSKPTAGNESLRRDKVQGASGGEAAAPRDASGPRRHFAQLDSFVVGPCNQLAFTSAQMIAQQPGCLSPLFVYGPTGVGKTVLLEGIWTAAKKHHRGAHAVYLSAEQFTTFFLEALRGSGLPNFRRKYRGVDLLIVDDLQFFAGKRATLVELVHTIDTLLQEGRQLVFAADRAPTALQELGPELMTRLSGGLACQIALPDQQTRLGIVRQIVARLGMSVPDDVQEFVATHLTSSARELSGALNRLRATSQSLGQPITLSMAEEAIGELVRQSGRILKLADIQRAVCEVFGLEPDSLKSDRKSKLVSHPRMLAMWLARKHTRAALAEIGQFFGRRSHSTVIAANKTVGHWMAQRSEVDVNDQQCPVEEAIRRVEQRLRAG